MTIKSKVAICAVICIVGGLIIAFAISVFKIAADEKKQMEGRSGI